MTQGARCCNILCGQVAEWSNAAVSKTAVLQGTGGSNPSLSGSGRMKDAMRRMKRDFFHLSDFMLHPFCVGQVSERFKEHDWNSCGCKSLVGSNPTLSDLISSCEVTKAAA